jgi:hypothetical protein
MLPNTIYTLWVATRGSKELFHVKHRYTLWVFIVLVFAAALFLPDRRTLSAFNNFISGYAFYFLYGYIPVLAIVQYFVHKARKSS